MRLFILFLLCWMTGAILECSERPDCLTCLSRSICIYVKVSGDYICITKSDVRKHAVSHSVKFDQCEKLFGHEVLVPADVNPKSSFENYGQQTQLENQVQSIIHALPAPSDDLLLSANMSNLAEQSVKKISVDSAEVIVNELNVTAIDQNMTQSPEITKPRPGCLLRIIYPEACEEKLLRSICRTLTLTRRYPNFTKLFRRWVKNNPMMHRQKECDEFFRKRQSAFCAGT